MTDDAMDVPGYEKLAGVLQRAYAQAAIGKGKERHADDKPFEAQPMQLIGDRRGIGFILGQADKKSEEAQGMLDRAERSAAVAELLGAINYLAGAVIWIDRHAPVADADEQEWIPVTPETIALPVETNIQVRHRNGTISKVFPAAVFFPLLQNTSVTHYRVVAD